MDEFNWDNLGWADWNTPVTDDNWLSDMPTTNWSDYDFGGGGGGDYNFGGGGGFDFGGSNWGGGTGSWDGGGFTSPTTAWWSGSSSPATLGGGFTSGQGGFDASQDAKNMGGFDTSLSPTAGNSGVTGAFGVDESKDNQRPSLLAGGGYDASQEAKNLGGFNTNNGPGLGETLSNAGKAVNSGIKATRDWAKENADLARLGIGIAGVMAARRDGKRSDELMQATLADRERQRQMQEELYRRQMEAMEAGMAMQEEAFGSQRDAVGRNNAQADYWNNQSRQSADEARSLYNPQELGIRGYANEAAANARTVQDIRDSMARKGKSQGSIDAEVRRAKLAGSTNATTGYMKGYDTGRSAQTGALSSAKGLGSNYSSLGSVSVPSASVPNFGSNADLARYYDGQAGDSSNAIQDLLNYYLGNPLGRSNENQIKG